MDKLTGDILRTYLSGLTEKQRQFLQIASQVRTLSSTSGATTSQVQAMDLKSDTDPKDRMGGLLGTLKQKSTPTGEPILKVIKRDEKGRNQWGINDKIVDPEELNRELEELEKL